MASHAFRMVTSGDAPHLGGNVRFGDPDTYCPTVWNYVIDRFGISSVMDLGSGVGNAAEYFFRKGLRVIAVDGMAYNVKVAIYPTVLHDLTQSAFNTTVDLVHCQEVVEHIDEAYLDNLIASLMCGRYILMTHAVPGQGGHHHVNCQPAEYWIEQMERRGCQTLHADSARIKRFAEADSAIYMAATGLLFANGARF